MGNLGVTGCTFDRNLCNVSADHLAMTDLKTASESSPPRVAGRSVRSFLHRFHTIAGIFIAPLLFVAALSGLFYALAPTAENIYYRDTLTATSEQEARPVSEQIAAAQKVHPELAFNAVQVFDNDDRTTRVLFTNPQLPKGQRQAVFVDPGDLRVTGDMPVAGSNNALPLRQFISLGHKNLWLGEPGRLYSELAASWMGALAISGTWLWWVRRKKIARGKEGSKRNGAVKTHSMLGLVVLPGLLFLTVTGLTWSSVAGANIGELRTQLNWRAPKPVVEMAAPTGSAAATPVDPHAEHGGAHGDAVMAHLVDSSALFEEADTVLLAARSAGLKDMVELKAPAEPGQAWTATENRLPNKFANDTITVDGASGARVDYVAFADWPLPAKVTDWLIQAHMGILLGWVTQAALALLAIGIMVTIGYGYLMWFRRGKGSGFGRLPSSGNWNATSKKALAGLLLCLAGYAIIAPLFGISLMLFAAAEVTYQKVASKRSGGRTPDRPPAAAAENIT